MEQKNYNTKNAPAACIEFARTITIQNLQVEMLAHVLSGQVAPWLWVFIAVQSLQVEMFACNNNNRYVERLTCAGPKRLHIL